MPTMMNRTSRERSSNPVNSVSSAKEPNNKPTITPDESALLLERCNAGDAAAWDTLIKQNEKSVYRFAYRLCRNYDDAADIAGQVFVRLYQNLHTFRHEASFSSWVFRIVRNTYLDICVRPACRNNVSLDSDNRATLPYLAYGSSRILLQRRKRGVLRMRLRECCLVQLNICPHISERCFECTTLRGNRMSKLPKSPDFRSER